MGGDPSGFPDGDDGYRAQVRGQVQCPGRCRLIEGTHPAAAVSQGHGCQKDVLGGSGGIL